MRFVALILFIISSVADATTVQDLTLDGSPYKYSPVSFEECANGDVCSETSKMDEFILVRADGGIQCPAGYYFILNSKTMVAESVDTGVCDPGFELTMAKSKKSGERLLVALRNNSIIWDHNLDDRQ